MTRTAARAAALALTGALTATLATTLSGGTPASADPAAERRDTTRVVLRVVGCDDCSFAPHSYRGDGTVWSAPGRQVRDGRVVFRVPTRLLKGMSISVRAPWERRTGAVGNVVFRYAGQEPGDRVTRQQAHRARKGSACFPGIDAAKLRLRVRVERAHFAGNGGRATGAAAYTVITQPAYGNKERVHDGFLGSQDVVPCG